MSFAHSFRQIGYFRKGEWLSSPLKSGRPTGSFFIELDEGVDDVESSGVESFKAEMNHFCDALNISSTLVTNKSWSGLMSFEGSMPPKTMSFLRKNWNSSSNFWHYRRLSASELSFKTSCKPAFFL